MVWGVGEGWVWAGKNQTIQEFIGILLALEEMFRRGKK